MAASLKLSRSAPFWLIFIEAATGTIFPPGLILATNCRWS